MNFDQLSQNALNAGNQTAALFKQTADQARGEYNQGLNDVNNSYGDYQNFVKNEQSGTDMYNNALNQAQSSIGFDPKALATATQNLTQSQNALQNMNQAAQDGVNGAGLTGAQLASRYATQIQPLQSAVGNQNNAVQNMQGLLTASQNQASQSSQLGYQQQTSQAAALNQVYQNALSKRDQAQKQMQAYDQLYAQQGTLNATQVQLYQQAHATMIQANAAMLASQAAMTQAQSQAALNSATIASTQQGDALKQSQYNDAKAAAAQKAAAVAKPQSNFWSDTGKNISNAFNGAAYNIGASLPTRIGW